MLQFYMVLVLQLATDVSKDTPPELAIVPIEIYLSSSLVSLVLTPLSSKLGRKVVYFIGTFFFVGSCAGMMLISNEKYKYLIFVIGPFLGIAQSMTFNIGLNYIVSIP